MNKDASKRAQAFGRLILLLAASVLLSGVAQADGSHAGIVGTWDLEIDTGMGEKSAALITYMLGGGLITSMDNPIPQTPGYGTWRRVGPRRFHIVFKKFRFSNDGELLFTAEIHETVQVNSKWDEYESVATKIRIIQPDGSVIELPGGPTTLGKRVKVED